jgi:hypothetical protein
LAGNTSTSLDETTSGNTVTGEYSLNETVSESVSTSDTGSGFSISQVTTSDLTTNQSGSDITGSFAETVAGTQTTLVEENGGLVSGSYSLTQSDSESISQDVNGNALTGEYTLTQTAIDSEEVWETGTNVTGSFSLTETSNLVTTLAETGNNLTGGWTQTLTTTDSYTLTETGNVGVGSFSMMETGVLTTTQTQSGSQTDGSSTIKETGQDSYTLQETGSDALGTFSETIVGSENATISQTATATTLSMRNESGSGTYTGTESGPGAVLPASGNYSYSLVESGNYQLGSLTITETGTDRYALLAGFNKGTSANGGSGGADFSPFGAPITAGMPAQVGTGSNAVGLSSPFAASAPGAAVASPVQGSAIVGADTQAQYLAPGPELFQQYCFAAGTPLLTPTSHKLIEEFVQGDAIMSAPEGDPNAPLEVKYVEEVFVNFAPIITVHVGGQVIRTTAEHPFYVWGRGWIAAGNLHKGDLFRGHDQKMAVVEAITNSGEQTKVYNLRISDYHTYFVGSREWGFSVWAHNAYKEFNIDLMGNFNKTENKYDGFAGHEMLQHGWLKANGLAGEQRGSTEASYNNPAMALSSPIHKAVGAQQAALGLNNPETLGKMSALENIESNAVAMVRAGGIPLDAIEKQIGQAVEHGQNLGQIPTGDGPTQDVLAAARTEWAIEEGII